MGRADAMSEEREGKPPADTACSLCGRKRAEVGRMISGPRVFICAGCVAELREEIGPTERQRPAASADESGRASGIVLDGRRRAGEAAVQRALDASVARRRAIADARPTLSPRPSVPPEHGGPACRFCSKTEVQVARLVTHGSVAMCDECLSLCEDILAEEADRENEGRAE
jgi:hypothetical protein